MMRKLQATFNNDVSGTGVSLKRQIAKGASWLTAMQFTLRGISLLNTLILARILLPSDFGLVALAVAVINFVEMLSDFGFNIYLLQKDKVEREDLDTVWTLQLLLAIITTLFIYLLSGPASHFFKEPRLKSVMIVLAVNTLAIGFRNVATVSFQRDLRFDVEFVLRVTAKTAGFITAVYLAYRLRNYWALVWGAVIFRTTEIVMGYLLMPYVPGFRLVKVKEICDFSKWVYAKTTLEYIVSKAPEVIVGRISGSGAVGFFSVIKSFTDLIGGELLSPVVRVFFVGGAKIRTESAALRDLYLSVFSVLAMIGVPAGLGFSAIAAPFVHVVLGKSWMESIPVLQILSVSVAVSSLQANIDGVFLSQGKPRIVTSFHFLFVLFLLPALVLLTFLYGITGAALAFLVCNFILAIIRFAVVAFSLHIRISDFIRASWRTFLASLMMYLTVQYSNLFLSKFNLNESVTLVFLIFIGAVCYAGILLGFWYLGGKPDGPERLGLKFIYECGIKKVWKKTLSQLY